MGTSSARKAPGGKFWRTAKITVARFAAGAEASPPKAKEVVARYLAALTADAADRKEAGGGVLPVIAETAASLGKFYRSWEQQGWETALAGLGLDAVAAGQTASMPALLDQLAGPGGSLEEAVARAALLDHLETVLAVAAAGQPTATFTAPNDALSRVSHFLGLALYHNLLSDLGESLEFHAPTVSLGYQRQAELRACLSAALSALEPLETADLSFSAHQLEAVLVRILTLPGQSG